MAIQLSDEEDDQPEEPTRPAYLDNPIARRYLNQFHALLLRFDKAVGDSEQPEGVQQLKSVLMAVHAQVDFMGNLDEVDQMLRLTFPSWFNPPESDSVPDLIQYPLSGSN